MLKKRFDKLKVWLGTSTGRRIVLFGGILAGILLIPDIAYALTVGEAILLLIAKLFELLTRLVGYILFLEVKALIEVAAYSNFVAPGPSAVQIGWVVARDLANMFFILILLVIAFATIVGYEEYNLRRLLPRLLIMAVVINFSKTITGIFIDMGQVIMLTFVNGFKEAAGGNFLSAFQIETLLQLKETGDVGHGGLVLGMMLAFIMVCVATAVVLIMLVTLIFRIVMLWVLIILAPIAFLSSTIPPGQKYYSMWWDELKRYVIYGPVVAFFLWIALLTAQISAATGNIAKHEGFTSETSGGATAQEIERLRGTGDAAIPTKAGTSDVFISMIIFTSLLFAGLKIATQTGGVAGGALGSLQGLTKKAVKTAGRIGAWGGKKAAGYGLRTGGAAARGAARGLNIGGSLAADKIGKTKLGQNKYARKAGRGLGLVGKLATGTLRGAGVVAGVQGRRVTGTGGLAKVKQAVTGSAEEVSALSPRSLAQRAWHASGKDAIDTAKALEANPAAKDAAVKSGSLKELYRQLKFDGKTDSGAKSAAEGLGKHIVGDLEGDEQKKALKKMKIEDIPKEAYKSEGVADHVRDQVKKNPKALDDIPAEAMEAVKESFSREMAGAAGNPQKVASLTVDAINVGALTAEDITTNKNGVGDAIGSNLNPAALRKRVGESTDPAVLGAATAAMGAFESKQPERAAKLRNTGEYDHIMPPKEQAPAAAETEEAAPPLETVDVDVSDLDEGPAKVSSSVADAYRSSASGGRGTASGAQAIKNRIGELKKSVSKYENKGMEAAELQGMFTDEMKSVLASHKEGSISKKERDDMLRELNEVKKQQEKLFDEAVEKDKELRKQISDLEA